MAKKLMKKDPKIGEQKRESGDKVGSSAAPSQVDNSPREAWMSLKDPKMANIGGYPTFGDSQTKSLGRAMQENKNANLASDIASKMTDQQMEELKKRARERVK